MGLPEKKHRNVRNLVLSVAQPSFAFWCPSASVFEVPTWSIQEPVRTARRWLIDCGTELRGLSTNPLGVDGNGPFVGGGRAGICIFALLSDV